MKEYGHSYEGTFRGSRDVYEYEGSREVGGAGWYGIRCREKEVEGS